MDAHRRIRDARDRWLELTAAESAALADMNWDTLGRCQEQKRILQTEIAELADQLEATARRQSPAELQRAASEMQLLFAPLIEAERRNAGTLERLRAETFERRHELERSRLNLRRLRQSYAPTRGFAWQSFS